MSEYEGQNLLLKLLKRQKVTEPASAKLNNALQLAAGYVHDYPNMSDKVAAREGMQTITDMRDLITAALEQM